MNFQHKFRASSFILPMLTHPPEPTVESDTTICFGVTSIGRTNVVLACTRLRRTATPTSVCSIRGHHTLFNELPTSALKAVKKTHRQLFCTTHSEKLNFRVQNFLTSSVAPLDDALAWWLAPSSLPWCFAQVSLPNSQVFMHEPFLSQQILAQPRCSSGRYSSPDSYHEVLPKSICSRAVFYIILSWNSYRNYARTCARQGIRTPVWL